VRLLYRSRFSKSVYLMATLGRYEIDGGRIWLIAPNVDSYGASAGDTQVLRRTAPFFDLRAGALWSFEFQTVAINEPPPGYGGTFGHHRVQYTPFALSTNPGDFFGVGVRHFSATSNFWGTNVIQYNARAARQQVTNNTLFPNPSLPPAEDVANWRLLVTADELLDSRGSAAGCVETWQMTAEVQLNEQTLIAWSDAVDIGNIEAQQLCNSVVEIAQASPAPLAGPDPFTPGTLWPDQYRIDYAAWEFTKPPVEE
jgi:hypothetical protein